MVFAKVRRQRAKKANGDGPSRAGEAAQDFAGRAEEGGPLRPCRGEEAGRARKGTASSDAGSSAVGTSPGEGENMKVAGEQS